MDHVLSAVAVPVAVALAGKRLGASFSPLLAFSCGAAAGCINLEYAGTIATALVAFVAYAARFSNSLVDLVALASGCVCAWALSRKMHAAVTLQHVNHPERSVLLQAAMMCIFIFGDFFSSPSDWAPEAAVSLTLLAGTAFATLAVAPLVLRRLPRTSEHGFNYCAFLCVSALLLAEYTVIAAALKREPLGWLAAIIVANGPSFLWLLTVTGAAFAIVAWFYYTGKHLSISGAKWWTTLTSGQRQLLNRKAFHLVALALFAPPLFYGIASKPSTGQVCSTALPFLQVASAGALHLAVLLELLRVGRALPGRALLLVTNGMAVFVDARDAGPFVLSHLYLIAGCGLPLWLSPSCCAFGIATPFAPQLAIVTNALLLQPLAGVLVAIGDAAAASGGITAASRGTAHPWVLRKPGLQTPIAAGFAPLAEVLSRKTLEGTASFTLAVWALCVALLFGASGLLSAPPFGASVTASYVALASSSLPWLVVALVAAAVETCTAGVDNLVLPVIAWSLFSTST